MATSGTGVGTPVSGAIQVSSTSELHPYPRTLMPLARYAKLMQISLPHFHQLNGPTAPTQGGCDSLWDQTARDSLEWAMLQAEDFIAQELGFYPAPKYVVNEELPFGINGMRGDWMKAEVSTKQKYVKEYGRELLTLKVANATVSYSDLDGDPFGRKELATLGNLPYGEIDACANACDVAVFFRQEDGAPSDGHPKYEIRPLTVNISGTSMTITGNASMFVRPELWNLTELDCLGSDDPNAWKHNYEVGNLVGNVDIYCRSTNAATPLILQWDGLCSCADSPCEHSSQTACAYPTDLQRGFFAPRPATWNGSAHVLATATFGRPPESVLVNYLAGYPLNNRTCGMDPRLERAIVKLTNALLPEKPCTFCDASQRLWEQDRADIDPLTPESASMPWQLYSRGALDAWRIVKMMMVGRGSKMGR